MVLTLIGLQEELIISLGFLFQITALVVKIVIAPAVVGYNGTVVGCPFNGLRVPAITSGAKHLTGNNGGASLSGSSVTAGNAGNTDSVVVNGSNGAGYMGSVFSGFYAGGSVAEVIAVGQIHMGRQVFVGEVHAGINYGHHNVGVSGGEVVPNGKCIHIGPGNGTLDTSGVYITPLLGIIRVVEEGGGLLLDATGTFHRFHTGNLCQGGFSLGGRNRSLIAYFVPFVKAGSAGTGFKLPGIGE